MSSLNQAFIKAYGRDPQNAAPAEAAPAREPSEITQPTSHVQTSWFAGDTWYRAESAAMASGAPVAPPHVTFPASYEPPTAAELQHLAGHEVPRHKTLAEDQEYRLSPLDSRQPEVVIDEEPQVPAAPAPAPLPAPKVVASSAPVPAALAAIAPVVSVLPVASPALPVSTPPLEKTPHLPVVPAVMTVNMSDASLADLFAPVQISTGWEAAFGLSSAITTESMSAPATPTPPAPVVASQPLVEVTPPKPTPAPTPAPAPEPAQVSPPVASQPAVVPPTPVVERPAVKAEERAPLTAATMRLDALTSAPVPQPHTKFATEVASPKSASSEPPAPQVAAQVTSPPAAPQAKIAEPKVAPPAAPVSPPPPANVGPLQPAWEVDRFQWPEHCKQLLSPQNQYLADVGQRLSVAARDGLNILAVTSTRRGEGRTTLALCLAKAAAAAGVKVALVDADLENPQLVNELGVEAATGWHDVVLNKQPLSEAAIVSLEDRFTFFPWLENSDLKSLNDPAVTRVLRAIAAEHTLVILDLGPVPGRETQLFEDGEACPIDAAILVRDVRWTSALEAQRVASQLMAAGTGSVGIAENFGPRVTQAA